MPDRLLDWLALRLCDVAALADWYVWRKWAVRYDVAYAGLDASRERYWYCKNHPHEDGWRPGLYV